MHLTDRQVVLNPVGLTDYEQFLLLQYNEPRVCTVSFVSAAVSVLLTGISLWRLNVQRSHFNAGVVLGCLCLLIDDVFYVVVLATNTSPMPAEFTRLLVPSIVSAQIAGLSLTRFQIFGARWFPRRIYLTLMVANYAILIATLAISINSMPMPAVRYGIPVDFLRKWTLTAQLGLTTVVDLILTGFTLRILLQLRSSLQALQRQSLVADAAANNNEVSMVQTSQSGMSSLWRRTNNNNSSRNRKLSKGYQVQLTRTIVALVSMIVTSVGGVIIYILSRDVFGQVTAKLVGRLYCLACMVEWYLIVDLIVEGRQPAKRENSGNIKSDYSTAKRPAAGGLTGNRTALSLRDEMISPSRSTTVGQGLMVPASVPTLSGSEGL